MPENCILLFNAISTHQLKARSVIVQYRLHNTHNGSYDSTERSCIDDDYIIHIMVHMILQNVRVSIDYMLTHHRHAFSYPLGPLPE